jgi:hypothetical protein
MAAKTYFVQNSTAPAAAAPVKQPTGTAIRTMMQLAPATGFPIRVIEWGCSFDGSAAAQPGQVELVDTLTVPATALSTAFVAGDVQPFSDPNAPANTAGTSGVPLNLGTGLSGFSTAAVTEGSVAAPLRYGDLQMLPPTAPYVKQFPLGREFEIPAGHFLRVRVTFPVTINMYCYVIFEV